MKPEDWKAFLARPEKHWKKGYSARELAYSWQNAIELPTEVHKIFDESEYKEFKGMEMLFGFPEHKVYFPPLEGATSQNDLFILTKTQSGKLISIMIEGKKSETFGPTLEEWKTENSPGKDERFTFIMDKLRLSRNVNTSLRYQLFHRLLSAILEAERYNASYAIMLIHSFSETNEWFDDYSKFVNLFNRKADIGKLNQLFVVDDIDVYSGWVHGKTKS